MRDYESMKEKLYILLDDYNVLLFKLKDYLEKVYLILYQKDAENVENGLFCDEEKYIKEILFYSTKFIGVEDLYLSVLKLSSLVLREVKSKKENLLVIQDDLRKFISDIFYGAWIFKSEFHSEISAVFTDKIIDNIVNTGVEIIDGIYYVEFAHCNDSIPQAIMSIDDKDISIPTYVLDLFVRLSNLLTSGEFITDNYLNEINDVCNNIKSLLLSPEKIIKLKEDNLKKLSKLLERISKLTNTNRIIQENTPTKETIEYYIDDSDDYNDDSDDYNDDGDNHG